MDDKEDSDQEWLTDDDDLPPAKKAKLLKSSEDINFDDGDDNVYDFRMRELDKSESENSDLKDEILENGLVVPKNLWNKLFDYQMKGVCWLWELHQQQVGGILADEMGLGKTVQLIVFLAALKYSKLPDPNGRVIGLGAVLIICPATLMHQWVREMHTWNKASRTAILHSIGTNKTKPGKFIHSMVQRRGILVTSYGTLLKHQLILLKYNWHYVVLDEGHKIRNPEAQITLVCKQLSSSHKIILSGSPMQNGLKELWSLFDFIFPGKLGSLSDFMTQFNVPIVMGGYSTASEIQVQTAYQCALSLRDIIAPYLLRRMKSDVNDAINLPGKNEQVLFCRLTEYQQNLYREYLESKECRDILKGKAMVFPGLVLMRKLCNHPDICANYLSSTSTVTEGAVDDCYGHWSRSCKMVVVESLLKLWRRQNHKVLFFTQSRQMLYIMEYFVKMKSYSYLKMDGETAIGSRHKLVNKFNQDPNIFIFLLTTKVGGLGINLTGADRVIIYDPDWNPSTDTQARERAWRIGQTRDVTIYRLICSGTIEEKIYHRQIFKQFLTNRVLKDARQRRFFKFNNLHELFTLGENEKGTETSAIFAGTNSEVKAEHVKRKLKKSNQFNLLRSNWSKIGYNKLTEGKIAKMRDRARKLSQIIGKNNVATADREVIVKDNLIIDDSTLGSTSIQTTDGIDSGSVLFSEKIADTVNLNNVKENETNLDLSKDKCFEKDVPSACVSIEGEIIQNCIKMDAYRPCSEEIVQPNITVEDDYVLHRLFRKTGIQGVMKHDKIMMSSSPDYLIVEAEAKRVAKNAAKALEQSRLNYEIQSKLSNNRFGKNKMKPTTVSAPKSDQSKSSATFSGAALLSNQPAEHTSADILAMLRSDSARDQSVHPDQYYHLAKQIVDFIAGHDTMTEEGRGMSRVTSLASSLGFPRSRVTTNVTSSDYIRGVTTEQLLDAFRRRLEPADSATFKALLRQLCDCSKEQGRPTVWSLKSRFMNLYDSTH